MTPPTLAPKQFRGQIVGEARGGALAEPRCQHAPPAGMCGGCSFQDRSYAAQIAAKESALRRLWAHDIHPDALAGVHVVGSPSPYSYRTRMDYVCAKERFGLRRPGKFNYIIDLAECHLIPPEAFAVARHAYQRAIAAGLPDRNLRDHTGFLRYVTIRRSPSDELLVVFITAAPDSEGRYAEALATIAAELLAGFPQVLGVHWLINDTVTDLALGEPRAHWGAATLPMRVGAATLQIGPNTFFQNNVYLTEPLLDDVARLAGHSDRLADLYGGVGTIALHLAGSAAQIVTVESVAESAALAQANIASNGATNVAGVEADTLAFLAGEAAGRFDVVVADPPRTGLGLDVCRELLRLRPRRIVYVSCNTLTQLADVRALAPGYRLRELRGYDMFPQTPHLEALALLEARA